MPVQLTGFEVMLAVCFCSLLRLCLVLLMVKASCPGHTSAICAVCLGYKVNKFFYFLDVSGREVAFHLPTGSLIFYLKKYIYIYDRAGTKIQTCSLIWSQYRDANLVPASPLPDDVTTATSMPVCCLEVLSCL